MAEVNCVGIQIRMTFKNKSIIEDWNNFLKLYHDAEGPITTKEGISEKDLIDKLNAGNKKIDNALENMLKEIPPLGQ